MNKEDLNILLSGIIFIIIFGGLYFLADSLSSNNEPKSKITLYGECIREASNNYAFVYNELCDTELNIGKSEWDDLNCKLNPDSEWVKRLGDIESDDIYKCGLKYNL